MKNISYSEDQTKLFVKEGDKIVLTLIKNENVRVKAYDSEENKWLDTVVRYDGEKIIAEDVDRNSEWQGLTWDVEQNDLLDKDQFKF